MSRTDLDPSTLAKALRCMAGDGSVEWVMEPIQASVLLDVADMLDENAKLREERDTYRDLVDCMVHPDIPDQLAAENVKLRELVADMLGYYAMPNNIDYKREAALLERARELGVEVNE